MIKRALLTCLIVAALVLALYRCARADPIYQSQTTACTRSAAWVNNTTPLVTSITGKQIYVCGFVFSGGTAASTAQLQSAATGGSCASPSAVTPTLQMATGTAIVDHQTFYAGLPPVASGNDLCASVSGAGAQAIVYYSQF